MNLFEKAINIISPSIGFKRAYNRMKLQALSTYSGQTTKRSMVGFNPRVDDPNTNTNRTLPDLRGKSRELVNTSSIGKSVIDVKSINIVGSGLHVESRIEHDILGISKEKAQEKQNLIERRFALWAKGNEVDMMQSDNFYSMQSKVFRAMLIDGDVLSLLYILSHDKRRPNQLNPLTIQNVGAHQLCNPQNRQDTETMIGGIDIDSHGAPKAYNIVSPSNKSLSFDGAMYGKWSKISKYGSKSGRLNVIHFKNPESRIGQYRGIPCLAPVIDLIYDLTKYQKSELTATVISSFFTVFVKTASGDAERSPIAQFKAPTDPQDSLLVNGSVASEATEADSNQYQFGEGMINHLAEGEDITTATPNRPNTAFEAFVQAMLTEIGMGIGVPYEMLVKKHQSSYSASRAAFLDAWQAFSQSREWIATQWCQPVYESWLELEVVNGDIELPGFLENPMFRKAWSAATWHGDARGVLDPVKSVKRSIMLIDNHLSTREREARMHTGGDWDQIVTRDAYEQKKIRDLRATTTPITEADNEK